MNAKVSQHAQRSTISKENRLDTSSGLLDSTTSDLIHGNGICHMYTHTYILLYFGCCQEVGLGL